MPRPEASGPPANYYDATEAAKYTSSSRIIRVQAEIAARCVELLNFPAGARRLVVDVGCGSGLSGAALATSLSQILAAGTYIALLLRRRLVRWSPLLRPPSQAGAGEGGEK